MIHLLYLLESVSGLARCCEGDFLHREKNCMIIPINCLPLSSRPFSNAELVNSPHSINNAQNW